MGLLEGRKALVTGAGRGIGRAIAEQFYLHGADVAVTDVRRDRAEEAAVQIRTHDRANSAVAYGMDVTDPDDVKRVFDAAIGELGSIDTLVNNAALLVTHEIKDFPLSDFQAVFRVNMEGTFICSQVAVNHMLERGIKGCILNVASASARKADRKHAAYSSSKAAILEFARVLALEVGEHGIRVNSLLPGATETEMLKEVFETVPGIREDIIGKTVLGKLGQPIDQANAAVFLCSDLASHITGEYLVVSGGEFFNA